MPIPLRLWGYTCVELSLGTWYFNICTKEMLWVEVGPFQGPNVAVLEPRGSIAPVVYRWSKGAARREESHTFACHQAPCAGGRIHPSKGKQHICRQEDLQKKQLSSSLEVLERCLGASPGFILSLAYGLPFCSIAFCCFPPREDFCLCLRPCTRSWVLRLWKHEYA